MITRRRQAPLPPRPGTRVIARTTTTRPVTAASKQTSAPRRLVRGLTRIGAVLVLAGLTTGIVTLSASDSVATADGVCIDTPASNTWGPEPVRAGIDGMIAQTGPGGTFDDDPLPGNYPTIEEAINDTSHTDYEKLGTAGTVFSVDYGSQDSDDNPCFPVTKVVGNFLSNSIFNLGKVVSRLSISTYQWATSGAVLSPLNEPLDELTRSYWLTTLKPFLAAAILLGVATVAWQFFMKRFQASFGSMVWMVVGTAVLLLYVVQPSWVASTIDEGVAKATTLTMAAGSRTAEDRDPHVAATYQRIRSENSDAAGARIAADMMWRTMVFQPWLAGQWGRGDALPIMMNTDPGTPPDTPAGWYDGSRDARYQQLYSQACVLDPAVAVCDANNTQADAAKIDVGAGTQSATRYAQGWYMVQNWTCTGADWCIGPAGNPDGSDDDDDREVTASNGWDYRSTWSGDRTDQRFLGALSGGAVSLSLGAIVFVLAAAVLVFDLIMYVLLFLAGFFLLFGIQPTWGRRLVEGLATTILQNALKRVMVGIALSVLITIFGVVQGTTWSWGQQIGVMIGTGVAMVMIRKPLMDSMGVVKVGSGGGGAFDGTADAATDKVTAAGRRGTAMARTGTTKGVSAAMRAPAQARRMTAGGQVGLEIARERSRQATEAGVPLTAGQQKRMQVAALRSGMRAGRAADSRPAAEFAAEKASGMAATMHGHTALRRADRKFANTEQGRAAATAQAARTAERGDAAHASRLAGRDDDIQVAALVNPARFGNTARNYDGTGDDGAARYTDRNRRRPAGSTSGRHAAQSDDAVVRGSDDVPDTAAQAPRDPRLSPQTEPAARSGVPLRAAAPWKRPDNPTPHRPTPARRRLTDDHLDRLREMRENSERSGAGR